DGRVADAGLVIRPQELRPAGRERLQEAGVERVAVPVRASPLGPVGGGGETGGEQAGGQQGQAPVHGTSESTGAVGAGAAPTTPGAARRQYRRGEQPGNRRAVTPRAERAPEALAPLAAKRVMD